MQNPLLKFQASWGHKKLPEHDWPEVKSIPEAKNLPAPGALPDSTELHRLSYKTQVAVLILETTDAAFLEAKRTRLGKLSHRPAWVDGDPLPEAVVEEGKEKSDSEPAEPEGTPSKRPRLKLKVAKAPEPIIQPDVDFNRLLQIAQEVKTSPFAERIMQRIILGSSPVDKLLLSSYYGEKEFGDQGLTAAQLEAITKALGIGMPQREIYRLLMRYNALFGIENSLDIMHEGAPPRYRLTMQGLKKFRKVLKIGKNELPAFT